MLRRSYVSICAVMSLQQFINAVNQANPGSEVDAKDKSTFQRLLSTLNLMGFHAFREKGGIVIRLDVE